MSGADALAEAIGGTPPQECSTDEKVNSNYLPKLKWLFHKY